MINQHFMHRVNLTGLVLKEIKIIKLETEKIHIHFSKDIFLPCYYSMKLDLTEQGVNLFLAALNKKIVKSILEEHKISYFFENGCSFFLEGTFGSGDLGVFSLGESDRP
jgi:hypothetical protein